MSAARARGGQLVVENVTLLSGGAKCFEQRYHVSLADDSFRKPGNTKVAFPLLHFLLCTIAPDDSSEFKPCFPVLDREQERDFKRIVDERLGRLERSKLLPLGVARKSTVATAGGDKFEQLVWTLSTFALKQAALRHPAHAGNQNPDPKPPPSGGTDANRKYAALLRSRIASERAAFARTTQMGRDSTERWTNEITQLKERIALIADRAAEVHDELKKMGYEDTEETTSAGKGLSTPETFAAPKHLVLKTSPIESDGSIFVDEADSDLTRLLAFSSESAGLAKDAEEIATNFEKSTRSSLGSDIPVSFPERVESTGMPEKLCANIVDLVHAAVEELQKATVRMNTVAKQQSSEISDISRDPSLETVDPNQPSALTQEARNSLELHQAIVQSTHSLADTARQVALDATESTQELVARTRELQAASGKFKGVRDSQDLASSLRVLSHVTAMTNTPNWMSEARNIGENESTTEGKKSGEYSDGDDSVSFELMDVDTVSSPPAAVDSKSDFLTTVEDLQKAQAVVLTARTGQTSRNQIETKPAPGKKSSIKRQVENHKVRIEDDVPFHQIPESKVSKQKKSGKMVRFAELPPSYSASKAGKNSHSPLVEPPPPDAKNSNSDTSKSIAESSDSSPDEAPQGTTNRNDEEFDPSSKVPLTRDETYVSPTGGRNQISLQQKYRPVQRKNTPRHFTSRRATANRNTLADRTDSTVVNPARQTLRRNFGVGRRPVSMNGSRPKAEPRKRPSSVPIQSKAPPSPAPLNTPEPRAEGSTIIVSLNDKRVSNAEMQPAANSEAEPVSPELDRKKQAPSLGIETAEAVVSTLDSDVKLENVYDGDRVEAYPPIDQTETTRPETKRREPVALVEETPQTHLGPRISSVGDLQTPKSKSSKRRHSSAHQASRFLPNSGKLKKKQPVKFGRPSSSSSIEIPEHEKVKQVPAAERVDNLSDGESERETRRSLSTPEYRVSNAAPPRKQRENSTAGRLISFPTLPGKRKEKEDGRVRKTSSERRRASISGSNSPFSWLNGSDRRSNIGRGETYHSPPESDGVFRTSSLFSGSRRSSVFGRRRSATPGSGRKERGDSSPRPSRVRALKDRIAALL